MANPLTMWFILLVIFVIVAGIFYKIIKALVKSILYAFVISLITLIVVLFFVHIDFQNFVKELDGPNYYLLEDEDGQIFLGYKENPYEIVPRGSASSFFPPSIESINEEYGNPGYGSKVIVGIETFGVHNMFIHSKKSLQDKDFNEVIFLNEKLSKDEAINRLFNDELSLTERTELFSIIVRNWDSKFFFKNLKNGNIKSHPRRNLLTFVKYSPNFLLPMFGFERVVEENVEEGKVVENV